MTAPAMLGLTALVCYLIGAIPFGYLVARARGVDIFLHGSGNIGATNVGRVLGKRFGILVFVLDLAKGALPTLVARWAGGDLLAIAAGLAAVLGHMFPIYLRFRGGKGVATGAGVVVVLLPWPTLGALLTWIALVSAFRYVSLASIGAAVALCLIHVFFASDPFSADHVLLTAFCFLAAGLVIVRHHANIGRLLHGSENRLPDSPTMLMFTRTVHVLAVGLWFGTVIFFTFVVGLSLFATFDHLTADKDRPWWLPVPPQLERELPPSRFPEPLRREQGSRIFGRAVGPLFVPYFLLQGICGVLAVATAVGLTRGQAGKIHRVRVWALLLALATVAVGWWLDGEVNARRDVRAARSDVVLLSAGPVSEGALSQANAARADFGRWHTYSLFANFATVALVTLGMALAAQLPAAVNDEAGTETKVETPDS